MPAKTHGDRLEHAIGILAERHFSLENAVAEFTTATRSAFDRVAAQFAAMTKRADEDRARTEQQFRETDAEIKALAAEGARRSRELDERVDTLVLAIGELIRRQDASKS